MQQMRAGAAQIKERTGGRVAIKFYPGGVMGNDAQVLRKVRIGQLQGGAFTAGGLAERYPPMNLYATLNAGRLAKASPKNWLAKTYLRLRFFQGKSSEN